MRNLDGLRVAAGARGEDQHERVVRGDLAVRRHLADAGNQRSPFRARRVEHLHTRQLDTVKQMPVVGIDQQDLAVHQGDVSGQPGTSADVVDTAQHVAAQCRGGQRRQHVGGVPQQHADMQRPAGIGNSHERRSLGTGLGDVLAPRPAAIAVAHRDRVLLGAFAKQLLKRVRHGQLTSVGCRAVW